MENYEKKQEKLTFEQSGMDTFDELYEKLLKDKAAKSCQ